jgi:hypothetical protein
MAKQRKAWVFSPAKKPKSSMPETLKAQVDTKAKELVETDLKPKFIQPPPKKPKFNSGRAGCGRRR